MRLHGLLSFYDEPVTSLVACIQGLARAGIDHLVAVDGAYALYPEAQAASHPNQHAAIHLACRELAIACSLHVPSTPWQGNEVEKRSFLFALAWACADEGDWFWVQDADMVVTECCPELKVHLGQATATTAEVNILDVVAQQAQQDNWPATFACRSLFRAQPITVGPAHYNYISAAGVDLWNGTGNDTAEGTLNLTEFVTVEHRPHERPGARQTAKLRYYADREAAGIERGPCVGCDSKAIKIIATGWHWSDIGPVAAWREVCADCSPEYERQARRELEGLGIDPDSVHVDNRNGHIPQET